MRDRTFHLWTHRVRHAGRVTVYPDGCRDVLIIRCAGEPAEVQLTPHDLRPRLAALSAGSALQGFRLRPGGLVSGKVLRAIAVAPGQAEAILGNDLRTSEEAERAIHALCEPGATVVGASGDLGLSVRSLQRLFRDKGLPPPDYWRLLARVRRAAALLGGPLPLAVIAADCGYSDQAHLTRAMVRWIGKTPGQLRRDDATRSLLAQPALGNWSEGVATGEQISTR
jgi:AraC-like DNA-binding protein